MNLKEISKSGVCQDTFDFVVGKMLHRIFDGVDFGDGIVYYLDEPDDAQSYVDLSVSNNPYEPEELVFNFNGESMVVPVYSVFRRYRDAVYSDANPLLFALKCERGWKISRHDREVIYSHIHDIVRKMTSVIRKDLTVIMPSSNLLNRYFSKEIEKGIGDINIYGSDIIVKRSSDEILEDIRLPESAFFKYYHRSSPYEYRQSVEKFLNYKSDMDRNHDGNFTYHCVRDEQMRNLITRTMKSVDENFEEASRLINGRDILLLDDSISRGSTIKEAIEIIGELYVPKSITVLTLFSKAY